MVVRAPFLAALGLSLVLVSRDLLSVPPRSLTISRAPGHSCTPAQPNLLKVRAIMALDQV